MTTQPTTGPTAADTTTSARETLHHLAHLTADPYIPEAHDDEDELYRDDVRDVLAAHGWTEGPDGFLRKDGALWTETNDGRDSGLDGHDGQYVVEFTREVPAPVITAACLAAAGVDVPALLAEVGRLRGERDALAKRVDTLTAVAQGNKRHVQHMYAELVEVQRERKTLRARVTELEAERATHRAAGLREAADGLRDMADTTPELRPGLRMGATRLDRMADTAASAGAEDGDQ